MNRKQKPLVVITGAAGSIGKSLADELKHDYRVVGLDLVTKGTDFECFECDITSDESVELALSRLREGYGDHVAALVHLAAYFDFTGEEKPAYKIVNEEGAQRLLRAFQDLQVDQIVYSSTMLVHEPVEPGELIDESSPVAPTWAYPQSKARTEEIVLAERGGAKVTLLRLAGLYDRETSVPTLSHQIARIYDRDIKSHLYSGDTRAGQAFIHRDDMLDLFHRTIDRRAQLPETCVILGGENRVVSYEELQKSIGSLIHGEDEWATIAVPAPVAKAGAWIEEKSEPIVPDDFDYGEKPFIRPFMVEMASDHYALDISRARQLLDWSPQHSLPDELPEMVAALKEDPYRWYRQNGITPPHWLTEAEEVFDDPERERNLDEAHYRRQFQQNIWSQWFNLGLATWLITSPPLLGFTSTAMIVSDVVSGIALLALSLLSLSWKHGWARWACAAIGCWVMSAPLVFWAPDATAYLNGTLVGALITGLAVLTPPYPGMGLLARRSGPDIPEGWTFSPSSWFQRLPLIILALVGLYVSRYLAAYQLDYISGVWDPFFGSDEIARNGTEAIITSSVSEAWPVPDAGIGALTYMLEILVGVAGTANRWRTMPWLVVLFGLMIVPLGAVSIYFIVIQPILIGTYCTLCLVAAAAMLVQIPYSIDELVACGQFLRRRHKAGKPVLKIFFTGDTDVGKRTDKDDFEQSPYAIIREMLTGGMSVPWNLAASGFLAIWLMMTPLIFNASEGLVATNHIAGALVLTITVTAFAEVGRSIRFLNIFVGGLLVLTPFALDASLIQTANNIVIGLLLMVLNVRRGTIRNTYGGWSRYII